MAGIELVHGTAEHALTGGNVGLLLRGAGRAELDRGQVLAAPGTVTAHARFEADAFALAKREGGRDAPFFSGYRPQFYFRNVDVTGAIRLPSGVEMFLPGDHVAMTVELAAETFIPLEVGLRFIFREGGHTVGAGSVTRVWE